MTVRKLLGDHVLRSACGDRAVAGLHYDSRQVRPGELFFAFAGEQVDGHRFAAAAINIDVCLKTNLFWRSFSTQVEPKSNHIHSPA